MLVACWSAKGGSGTTVVAASLAVLLARSSETGALFVDLAGDAPAVLGLPEPSGAGLADWFAAGSEVPVDGLRRLEVPAAERLRLLPRGVGALGDGEAAVVGALSCGPAAAGDRAEVLAALLATDGRAVVADCGSGPVGAALTVVAAATHSLLVTRPCYLSLRRAVAAPLRPSGVVLVREPGRALGRADVEEVLGVPVRAEVLVDPAVARAVDAGLLASRLPRTLERSLRHAA
ncbi:MAG: hypothetical protein IPM45_11890 [Acidimicrobiales bacterium]|nr:hypothetical protein [Acidimicrobiales bacterium]